ncbi:MAG: hypothetical protein NC212_00200 [Staphylococcus sp.]|nr:hypothetical protein [Staphylococcus sp.]
MSATKQLPHEKPEWTGYTLDQIRYMRAYTAARLEINRDRMQRNLANLKNAGPVSKSGILGKVLGTLSYLDIALVTFRIGSKALKAMRLFRRK